MECCWHCLTGYTYINPFGEPECLQCGANEPPILASEAPFGKKLHGGFQSGLQRVSHPTDKGATGLKAERNEEIQTLRSQGHSPQIIAEKVHLAVHTVHGILRFGR